MQRVKLDVQRVHHVRCDRVYIRVPADTGVIPRLLHRYGIAKRYRVSLSAVQRDFRAARSRFEAVFTEIGPPLMGRFHRSGINSYFIRGQVHRVINEHTDGLFPQGKIRPVFQDHPRFGAYQRICFRTARTDCDPFQLIFLMIQQRQHRLFAAIFRCLRFGYAQQANSRG